eukprot:7599458-Karenia_brevis.AAC.1
MVRGRASQGSVSIQGTAQGQGRTGPIAQGEQVSSPLWVHCLGRLIAGSALPVAKSGHGTSTGLASAAFTLPKFADSSAEIFSKMSTPYQFASTLS